MIFIGAKISVLRFFLRRRKLKENQSSSLDTPAKDLTLDIKITALGLRAEVVLLTIVGTAVDRQLHVGILGPGQLRQRGDQ